MHNNTCLSRITFQEERAATATARTDLLLKEKQGNCYGLCKRHTDSEERREFTNPFSGLAKACAEWRDDDFVT